MLEGGGRKKGQREEGLLNSECGRLTRLRPLGRDLRLRPDFPHPRYHRAAEFAFVSNQIIGRNEIAPAFDQQLSAIVAVGVVSFMPGHVAHVNIVNPFGHGQFPETRQDRDRRRGQSIQFIAREKP